MTRQQDGTVLFAVYGTLRHGWGNNRILCMPGGKPNGGVEYMGIMKTEPRFNMYSLGGFPGVAEGGNTAIVIEVFKVSDESIIDSVNNLEGYSGMRGHRSNWYDTVEVQTPWGTANMFTMNKLNEGGRAIVASGDWNEHNNRTERKYVQYTEPVAEETK
ncbi:MAG TPA: gamma-glutamylcyclotransferase [Flavisolibacter sp.]